MLQLNETDERILKEAWYIVENNATIRQTANVFGISKTRIHDDLTKKLPNLNYQLFLEVRKILDFNLSVRAYRGGKAVWIKRKK